MKRTKILIPIIALSTLLSFDSCKDALEEKPYSFLAPENMGDSPEAAQMMVDGVKATFNSGAFFAYAIFNRVHDIDSDDATGPTWAFTTTGAGNFSGNGDINAYWNNLYLLVARANFAYSVVNKMTAIDEGSKNNALGELNFYRAWAYFTLVKAFGGVPLYPVSVTEGADPNPPRASVAEVYGYIVDRLKESETQLYSRTNAKYKEGNLSMEAAKTMLAKVYLTMASGALKSGVVKVYGGPQGARNNRKEPTLLSINKNVVAGHENFDATEYFTLARNKAKEVMDNSSASGVALFPTWADVWKRENRGKREHLWTMYAQANSEEFGNFLSYAYYGVRSAADPERRVAGGGGQYGLSDVWYDLFESNDARIREGVDHKWKDSNGNLQWYPKKEYGDPTKGWVSGYNYADDDSHLALTTKFADVSDKSIFRNDAAYPWLRYAETLLIFAEAENEVNGPTQLAIDAMNQVRGRSRASLVSLADFNNDKVAFRSQVLEERRRELAVEGNRPWDLRRWGIYLQVMNAIGGLDINGIIKTREPKHLLFPIPDDEMNGNSSIENNNPGW
ncbi:RagB/SusD family nutrient uptake outer membrane protein [Desertivirga arenae]|uniref:RagB/SusD family nutrient uptake outer membrane protein n=1 Tax=Desertivirga arenae TaxID=2810309 RepID=UPI001A962A37|nr:RagB/SusD family nutrient uptake outer membrane protein [Pedobacter sp. SYSU D00823]